VIALRAHDAAGILSARVVNISKPVVIAFCAAFVVALVAIGYLVGREQGRQQQGDTAPAVPPPVASSTPPAPRATDPAPRAPDPAPTADAARIRDYLAQMDALAGVNPFGDDGQGAADRLLASAIGGDLSGVDTLVKVASDAAAKAKQITPPQVCAHYHRAMVAALDQTVGLLRTLRSALAKGDSAALGSLVVSASSLQSQIGELQREAASIKAANGIR
jgi:hypothetical protein